MIKSVKNSNTEKWQYKALQIQAPKLRKIRGFLRSVVFIPHVIVSANRHSNCPKEFYDCFVEVR
jgi:hypothetical protein